MRRTKIAAIACYGFTFLILAPLCAAAADVEVLYADSLARRATYLRRRRRPSSSRT